MPHKHSDRDRTLLDGRELLPGKLELHQLVGDGVVENLLGDLLMCESHLAMGQVEHEGCGKLGEVADELW